MYGERGCGVGIVSTARKLIMAVCAILTDNVDFDGTPLKLTLKEEEFVK